MLPLCPDIMISHLFPSNMKCKTVSMIHNSFVTLRSSNRTVVMLRKCLGRWTLLFPGRSLMSCWFELLEVMMRSADLSPWSPSQGDGSSVQVGQHRPGRPLQLQQVLHRHLCEGVAGVQVHDQPHHHSDQHGDLGGVTSTLTERQAATLEAVQYCTREGRVKTWLYK